MIRQTIIANSDNYTIFFPKDWIGKKVLVTYEKAQEIISPETRNGQPSDIFKKYQIDMSKYSFNRDDANDYE